jgi:hypothetical protein
MMLGWMPSGQSLDFQAVSHRYGRSDRMLRSDETHVAQKYCGYRDLSGSVRNLSRGRPTFKADGTPVYPRRMPTFDAPGTVGGLARTTQFGELLDFNPIGLPIWSTEYSAHQYAAGIPLHIFTSGCSSCLALDLLTWMSFATRYE